MPNVVAKAPMHLLGGKESHKEITGTTTLGVHETDVSIFATASDDYDITLPPLASAQGLIYSVYMRNAVASVTIGVIGGTDSSYDSAHLTTAADHVVLYCTGEAWLELVNVTT